MWNKLCEVCGDRLPEVHGRRRPKLYCSNRCKMVARGRRGFVDRYTTGNSGKRYLRRYPLWLQLKKKSSNGHVTDL